MGKMWPSSPIKVDNCVILEAISGADPGFLDRRFKFT